MAAAMSIEAVFAALPNGPLNETEFDDALRKIFKIAEWDNAKLQMYRTTAFHNRLIVEDADGRLVKAAALPHWPTEEERFAEIRAHDRRLRFPPAPKHWDGQALVDEPAFNVFAQHADMLRAEFGLRFDALEEQLRHLQQQIEALTPQVAA